MKSLVISLPDSLQTFIDHQLAAKGFEDVSEYFCSLLREEKEREAEARLEAALLEGLVSGGEDIPLTPAFWNDLESNALKIARRTRNNLDCA